MLRPMTKPHLQLHLRVTWRPYHEDWFSTWMVSTAERRVDGSLIRTTWFNTSAQAIRAAVRHEWYVEPIRAFWAFTDGP